MKTEKIKIGGLSALKGELETMILLAELLFRKVPVVQVGSETPGINESLVTMEFINDLANSKLTG